MNGPTMLEAALELTRLGPVGPLHSVVDGRCTCGAADCASPGKHPRSRHGLHDFTRDPERIRAFGDRWKKSNLGLGTELVTILDIDAEDPFEATAEWPAFETLGGPVVRTGRLGWHLYFEASGHGNRARIAGAPVDLRGTGGYVVAPPSVHASGLPYTWYASADLELQPMPAELLAIIDPPRPARPAGPPPTPARGGWSGSGLVGRLACAAEGERNTVLNWAAHAVGRDVHFRRATIDQAVDVLRQIEQVAEMVGLEAREIEATMRSGYSRGLAGAA